MRKDSKPKWEIQKALAAGREALALAKEQKEAVEPRLQAGALDGLAADLAQLDGLRSGRPARTTLVHGLTGSQKEIAKRGAKWVNAIRGSVKRHGAGEGLRGAVGVGQPVRSGLATSVTTALETILDAAKERPDEIRACGILDADLQNGQALLSALAGARATQDEGMTGKKDLTTLKDKVQVRLEAAVESISSSGYLEFLDRDPLLAQRFADLIPNSGGGDGDEGEPPADPATPAAK